MDKSHLEKVLEKVRHLRVDEAHTLTIEDVGILGMFLEKSASMGKEGGTLDVLSRHVRQLLDAWEESRPAESDNETPDNERRNQHLLRAAIDKLQKEDWNSVTKEETDLVRLTHLHLQKKSQAGDRSNDRLVKILDDALSKYSRSRQQLFKKKNT